MTPAEEFNLCNLAVEKGFITSAQFQECQEVQKQVTQLGVKKTLLEILIDKEYLSKEQVQSLQRASGRTTKELGDFELLAKLGEGGMGVVYKARQKRMGRIVALKILSPRLAKNKDFIERFYREARSAARLNHVNIVSAIDTGEMEGYHYFVMEYIEGKSLYRLIKEKKVIPEDEALHIAIQITRALQHAHTHNMVHRDIKPHNVIINSEGVAKLTDLGLAKSTAGEDVSLTQTGMTVGTPDYISPEQARGEADIDIRTDIYSLGATLYHMVTGAPPFSGTTAAVVMTKHLTEEIPSPLEKNPNLSENICHLIEKMMAKSREDRYQTPEGLLNDLELVIDGKSPTAVMLAVGQSTVRRVPLEVRERLSQQRVGRRMVERPVKSSFIPLVAGIGVVVVLLVVILVVVNRPKPTKPVEPSSDATPESPTPSAAVTPTETTTVLEEQEAEGLFKQATEEFSKDLWFTAQDILQRLSSSHLKETKSYSAKSTLISQKLKECTNKIGELVGVVKNLVQRRQESEKDKKWNEALAAVDGLNQRFDKYGEYLQKIPEIKPIVLSNSEYYDRYNREIDAEDKLDSAKELTENGDYIKAQRIYNDLLSLYKDTKTVRDEENTIRQQLTLIESRAAYTRQLSEVIQLINGRQWEPAKKILFSIKDELAKQPRMPANDAASQEVERLIQECNKKIGELKYKDNLKVLIGEWERMINTLPHPPDEYKPVITRLRKFQEQYETSLTPDEKEIFESMLWFCLAQCGQEKLLLSNGLVRDDERKTYIYNTDLVMVNPDGSNLHNLTEGKTTVGGMLSPDGRRLAYAAQEGQQKFPSIYLRNLNESSSKMLTNFYSDSPVWSPDGRRILCEVKESLSESFICEIDINREKEFVLPILSDSPILKRIAKPDNEGLFYRSPSYSPDGKRIAFYSVSQSASPIWINENGRSNQLTKGAKFYAYPIWLPPDGKKVICQGLTTSVSGRRSFTEIVTIDSQSGLIKDTFPLRNEALLRSAVSPDGKTLYYSSEDTTKKATYLLKSLDLKTKKSDVIKLLDEPAHGLSVVRVPYKIGLIVGPLVTNEKNWQEIISAYEDLKDTPNLFTTFVDLSISGDKRRDALLDNFRKIKFLGDAKRLGEFRNDIYLDTLIMNQTSRVTDDMVRAIKEFVKKGGNLIIVGTVGSVQRPTDNEWANNIMGFKQVSTPLGCDAEIKLVGLRQGHNLLARLPKEILDKPHNLRTTYWANINPEEVIAEFNGTDSKGVEVKIPAIMERRYGQGRIVHLNWNMRSEARDVLPAVVEYLRTRPLITTLKSTPEATSGKWTRSEAIPSDVIMPVMKFLGRWEERPNKQYSGGTARFCNIPTAIVSCTFKGRGIRIIGSKGKWGGRIEIKLDGQLEAVERWLWENEDKHQQILFEKTGLTNDNHTISIEILKALKPGGNTSCVIDAFEVLE